MSKVGIIGSGVVGKTLAGGFLKHGYEVRRGTREPAKLVEWKAKADPKASVGTFAEAAAFGSLVVLATKGTASEAAVRLADPAHLAGKTVIDAANPIADTPPVNGVLSFFTGPNDSLYFGSASAPALAARLPGLRRRSPAAASRKSGSRP